MTEWDEAERRVEKAHELYERGRWEEALNELQAAIAINPYNGSWYFNLGLTLDAMDRTDEAIAAYKRAVEMDPNDVEVLNALGNNCNRTGKFDEAIGFFERIEAIDSSFEPGYCSRIVSYSEKGDHEKAEEMFYLAREYKEQCPLCLYHMGGSLFARGQFDRALWCWERVVELDPDHKRVHARMGDALWAKGQLAEARRHFIEELRSSPGDLDVLLDLGELLVEMGDRAAAAEKFRQVVELAPHECTAMFHLGQLAFLDGDMNLAMDLFRRVLRADGAFPGAHLRIAQIHHRKGEMDEALFHANSELAQRHHEHEVLVELGNLFMDMGQLKSAERAFERVLAANPRNVGARHGLSVAMMTGGRVDEGIEQARRALRIQPKHMLAMHNLALAYLSKKDFARARFWLREALDISPDDPGLRQLQAVLPMKRVLHVISALPRKLLARR